MSSMIPTNVQTCLQRHGLSALEFEPGSTPTSELAAARIGVAVGQIAKSMLFKAKDGGFHLVVCAGDQRVCSKKLKQHIGVKARMATTEETFSVTGFRPGGVCPFGLEAVVDSASTPLTIHIDVSLQGHAQVYPAAGTDATGVPTTYAQLLDITQGTASDIMSSG